MLVGSWEVDKSGIHGRGEKGFVGVLVRETM